MGDQTQKALGQLIRYNLVGLANTLVAYLLYAGLVYLGVEYAVALAADYLLGAAVNFWVNKHYTFGHKEKTQLSMVLRQAVTVALTYGVNLLVLWLLVEQVGLNEYIGQGSALLGVMAMGFVGQKFWVFKR